MTSLCDLRRQSELCNLKKTEKVFPSIGPCYSPGADP